MSTQFPTAIARDDLDAAPPGLDKARTVEQSLETTRALPTQLPPPSPAKISSSLTEKAFDIHSLDSPLSNDAKDGNSTDSDSSSSTVLYFGFGSNLCYQTFQGVRGIRPLSAANVVAPDLMLTFDLPGVPYAEPCFANSRWTSSDHGSTKGPVQRPAEYHDPVWSKGLVGVVYEVTKRDYAHIIATEGGGSAYTDILVPCYLLPRDDGKGDGATHTSTVPEDPASADPPLPYCKAHTLSCPGTTVDGRRVFRPDRDYAQPSLRYLNLLRTGAKEHRLPQEYQDYLQALHPFTISTKRQEMGAWLFNRIWHPLMMSTLSLNKRFADHRGRSPRWLRMLFSALVRSLWTSYDGVFRPMFGDGERTIEDGGAHGIGATAGAGAAKVDGLGSTMTDDTTRTTKSKSES